MICNTCGADPCINPGFCRTCREADAKQRRPAEISKFSGRAAKSTVEALMFQLRDGMKALEDPSARRRLSELSDEQLIEVGARLQRFSPDIATAWPTHDVATLMERRELLR
jgi:hypothetical protein